MKLRICLFIKRENYGSLSQTFVLVFMRTTYVAQKDGLSNANI